MRRRSAASSDSSPAVFPYRTPAPTPLQRCNGCGREVVTVRLDTTSCPACRREAAPPAETIVANVGRWFRTLVVLCLAVVALVATPLLLAFALQQLHLQHVVGTAVGVVMAGAALFLGALALWSLYPRPGAVLTHDPR